MTTSEFFASPEHRQFIAREAERSTRQSAQVTQRIAAEPGRTEIDQEFWDACRKGAESARAGVAHLQRI
jgi:hypothetical protein